MNGKSSFLSVHAPPPPFSMRSTTQELQPVQGLM